MTQLYLLPEFSPPSTKQYRGELTVVENQKGVLDVDTVKGCACGMSAYPGSGCYGECYANKGASRYGVDFEISVSRKLLPSTRDAVFHAVKGHRATWYRIGVSGDPCHDWENTLDVCDFLRGTGKIPVIITKHWVKLLEEHVTRFKRLKAVFNTSTSGIDTDAEMKHRVAQLYRLRAAGLVSVNRVVTCEFGTSEWAVAAKRKQEYLLSLTPIIDNPLRASKTNPRVISGDIILTRREDAVGGGKFVSLHNKSIFLGHCDNCPDQCGVSSAQKQTIIK